MADIINLTAQHLGGAGMEAVYAIPNSSMIILQDLINATWNEAKDSKTDFSSKITAAMAGFLDTLSSPHVTAGSVTVPTITEPTSSLAAGDVVTAFNAESTTLIGELLTKFAAFRTTYFPDEATAYTAAEDWLQEAIANPAGLPDSVAAQIYGDDQARILGETTRASDAAIAAFAGRRFPLPVDAAASAVMQIQQKAQEELASSSRKVAMIAIDLQKFNVEKIIGLRGMAMDAATKYIGIVAAGQDAASKAVATGYDAESRLLAATTELYRARSGAADVLSKIAQYNNSTALEASAKNQMADLQMIESKLKALLAEAQAIAQMTTSLFNNLHVGASLSANGGSVLSATNTF